MNPYETSSAPPLLRAHAAGFDVVQVLVLDDRVLVVSTPAKNTLACVVISPASPSLRKNTGLGLL